MNVVTDADIAADIKRVANSLHCKQLSRSQYLPHGRYTMYDLYDGGRTWEGLCTAAGVATMKVEIVPDEVYFQRLQKAIQDLGRLPKVSERKKFGLNFNKRRYPTLNAFIERAVNLGIITGLTNPKLENHGSISEESFTHVFVPEEKKNESNSRVARPVPPIPIQTKRTKWERTGIDGFPYAPQDELGVVALFGILCSKGVIGWQILELRGGKGIDTTCFDHVMQREIHVELKHILSRATWNHKIEDIDYAVCWENRWPDFPKPVIVLRDLLRDI
jgi:hypothetical protein